MIDPKDSGYASRKLVYAAGTSVFIFAGSVLAARWAAFSPYYGNMVAGLLGALSIYSGVNTATKWVASRHMVAMADKGFPNGEEDNESSRPDVSVPEEEEEDTC